MLTLSNPRRNAAFTDWPLLAGKRGTCVFVVHVDPRRGERIARTTTGKPKLTTYATKCCIVDGSDGKTYLLEYNAMYRMVRVGQSDCMHDASKDVLGHEAGIFADSNPDKFAELKALIDSAK